MAKAINPPASADEVAADVGEAEGGQSVESADNAGSPDGGADQQSGTDNNDGAVQTPPVVDAVTDPDPKTDEPAADADADAVAVAAESDVSKLTVEFPVTVRVRNDSDWLFACRVSGALLSSGGAQVVTLEDEAQATAFAESVEAFRAAHFVDRGLIQVDPI